MTIAETHGKISSSGSNLHDQLEDLLTSDVFSACKYLKPSTLLIPFLSTAVSLAGRSPSLDFSEDIEHARYIFWPRLAHGEPDLVIFLEHRSGKADIVLVEAKYYSGKSGTALDADERELAVAPADQLAREYEDLLTLEDQMHLDTGKFGSRVMLYVTAHRSIPAASLEESMAEIARFRPDLPVGEVYWTSWFRLLPLLEELRDVEAWERPIIDDLQALLVKKGFLSFAGYGRIARLQSSVKVSFYGNAHSGIGGDFDWGLPFVGEVDWYMSQWERSDNAFFGSVATVSDEVAFYTFGGAE